MRSTLWSRCHRETTAWAVRANDELLAELSPAVAGSVRARRETQVALYGPTQSGKTTLVLRMLGVADDAFGEVERVLRGGRSAGNSSTAVPMRYSRSEDDRWRVGAVDGEALDEGEIVGRLRGWRQQVEEGTYASTNPVALFIPSRHFADHSPPVRVSVLDLPGSHAAARKERELVRRIAERHLPSASLILLVSRADNLGVFDPKRLGQELEQLRDWMSYPERYRLVTTHSYSSASVRERWEGGLLSGVEQVRTMMLDQFGRFEEVRGRTGFGSVPFYPLEHGASWEALRTNASLYFAWAERVQQVMLAELAEDINGSAEGGRRLDLGRTMAREIHRRHERLQSEYRAARNAWREGAARRAQECKLAAEAAELSHAKLEELRAKALALSQIADLADEVSAKLGDFDLPGEPQAEGRAVRKWLEDSADAVDQWLRSSFPDCAPPSRRRFEPLFERLDDYWFDYWPKLANGFLRDVEAGRRAIEDHRLGAVAAAQRLLRNRRVEDRRSIAKQQREVATRYSLLSQQLADCRKEFESGNKTWATTRRERLDGIVTARRDKVRADQFDDKMRRHYQLEASRVFLEVRRAARAGAPALALARLCQLRLNATVFSERCESTT